MTHVICSIVVGSRIDEFHGNQHQNLDNVLGIFMVNPQKNEMTRVIFVILVLSRFDEFHGNYHEKCR